MKIFDFSPDQAQAIQQFNSISSSSVPLARGQGMTHVYCLYFNAGEIGTHIAGFDQLLLVVQGSGWVESEGQRFTLNAGQGAFLKKGANHAKGSKSGMMAIMIQADKFELF